MNYLVIADEDTVLGFSYAGVPGIVVQTPAQAAEELRHACEDPEIGVVILNDSVAKSIRDQVNEIRFERDRPVLVEIPGPSGPDPERLQLMRLIQEAVGIGL